MTMKFVLFLALLLPLASVVEFEFMYLVQKWPGSYCDTEGGCCFPPTWKPVADFLIHGLWPTNGDVDEPVYCTDKKFDPKKVRDMTKLLKLYWPTLTCKQTDFQFWSHEWSKHGTCSNVSQHDYFNTTLALKVAGGNRIVDILADAGIVPSDEETYSLSSISDAIAEGTRFRANLECNVDASGESQLSQVLQCVDHSAHSLIDCRKPLLPIKCLDRVKLPLFPRPSSSVRPPL